jgi:signal transduction histidine kinase
MNANRFLIGFGFLATIGIIVFYYQSRNVEINVARNNQYNQLKHIKNKLDEFIINSNVISKFIQEDIENNQYDRSALEKRLKQYLNSSSEEVIYGIGVWYEPFQFSKKDKYFGPYVHRDNKSIKLTYEWNTKEYDYHNQTWYSKGKLSGNKDENVFIDPYFDNGLVYVTNSRSFFNNKVVQGVISVDLVLPMLQKLIEKESRDGNNIVYIVNRDGKLLAHPYKENFFHNQVGRLNKTNDSLLNYGPKDLNELLETNEENWLQSSILQDQLGWRIVSLTSFQKIFLGVKSLEFFLFIAGISLWVIILYIFYTSHKLSRIKQESERIIEEGRMKLIQSSKMASLGEMASGIAHEINNPLMVIQGKVKQIQRELEKENIQNDNLHLNLNKIGNTVDRINQIITGLRNFSRSAEKDPLLEEELSFVIENTVSLCTEKFKISAINFDIQTCPNVKIKCRRSQISQVLLNLLSNSFDAINTLDEKWIKIKFQLLDFDRKIKIEIIDSGKGISAEIAQKIMDPFYTTKEVGKGTGLGLSISKGIAEDHGGVLEYNPENENTTFHLILPCSLADNKNIKDS